MQPPATLFREQNKTLHTCYDMWQCIASIGPPFKNCGEAATTTLGLKGRQT